MARGIGTGGPVIRFRLLGPIELQDSGQRPLNEPWVHRLLAKGQLPEALDQIRKGGMRPDGPVDACHICFYRTLGDAFDRMANRIRRLSCTRSTSRTTESCLVKQAAGTEWGTG